jgi:DNA-binding NarL/FixJ family response regulator
MSSAQPEKAPAEMSEDGGLREAQSGRARAGGNGRSTTRLGAASALARSAGEPAGGAEPITVVLGHFDALLGLGLAQTLSEDRSLQIVGADLDLADLEEAVASKAPQVALLDETTVVRPTTLEHLRAAQPAIGIVVLAHRPTLAYAMLLFAAGASCLSKNASGADILATIHIAADGRRAFVDVDGHLVERRHSATAAILTPREVEVLEYLSRGLSHGQVAHALQLGYETIRTHSAHIRVKLGVRRSRDLIGLPIPVDAETKIR